MKSLGDINRSDKEHTDYTEKRYTLWEQKKHTKAEGTLFAWENVQEQSKKKNLNGDDNMLEPGICHQFAQLWTLRKFDLSENKNWVKHEFDSFLLSEKKEN